MKIDMVEEFVGATRRLEDRRIGGVAVDGQRISVRGMRQAIDFTIGRLKRGEGFSFLTLNLDHLVKRRSDAAVRAAYQRADFVSADGYPVVALARSAGVTIERVTGADLVVPLCRAAADAGLPVFLFGTSDPVLDAAAAYLVRDCPHLVIAGRLAPAMGFDPTSVAADLAAAAIENSGARLCFVALPTVKQLAFMDRFRVRHPAIGFVGVGAALDFLAGSQSRAPLMVQRAGLEWLWRLGAQPRTLLPRYLACAWLYLRLRLTHNAAIPS